VSGECGLSLFLSIAPLFLPVCLREQFFPLAFPDARPRCFCPDEFLPLLIDFLVVTADKASASAYVAIPSAPAVVATIALYNQTANIPTTTLFTPATNGLYRFTAYMAETVAGGTGGIWSLEVYWNDFAGSLDHRDGM
jgi:hypothetical protein